MKRGCFLMIFVLWLFNTTNLLAQDWNIQTVDNSGDVGKWCEVAYDNQNYPHIAYFNETNRSLMYARWNGVGWEIEQVDELRPNRVGEYCSIAVDQFGRPHISYYYSRGRLRYTVKTETGEWEIIDVDDDEDAGYYTSIALTYDEGWEKVVPHIVYHREQDGDLYYATQNAETGEWLLTPIDESTDVGEWTDIAMDAEGHIYVSYYDAADADLKFAYFDGEQWSTMIVDGADSDVGKMTSIALDQDGVPHITYYDETNGELKHAKLTR